MNTSNMSQKTKARLFFVLLIMMIGYILWSFYISEPKYENGANSRKIETYDWVSLPESKYSWEDDSNRNVMNGLVLQVDETKALVKTEGRYSFSGDEMVEVDIKAHKYRIVGKGTIYHKVNNWVGFNIMIITQIFIGIVAGILMITQTKLLSDLI
jgi:hypothetical protein